MFYSKRMVWNVVCKMATISSRGRWVNSFWLSDVILHFTSWSSTHWGRVTHICVGRLTIIGSDNALSPERRQGIFWTNAGLLLIGPLGTNINEISIEIQTFSLKKRHLKMSSAIWRPFCLGLNVSMPTKQRPLDLHQIDIYLNGLVQERRNSIANALELRLSCINPLIGCSGISSVWG